MGSFAGMQCLLWSPEPIFYAVPLGVGASGAAYVSLRLTRKDAKIRERLAFLGPIEQEVMAAGLVRYTVL